MGLRNGASNIKSADFLFHFGNHFDGKIRRRNVLKTYDRITVNEESKNPENKNIKSSDTEFVLKNIGISTKLFSMKERSQLKLFTYF